GVAEGLQAGISQARDVAQVDEAEGAVEGGVAVLVGGPSFVGSQSVDADDIEVISFALAGEAGAFNDVARGLLFANPEIDLTGARVVHAGSDRYSLGEWVREVVLPLEQAAVWGFVGGAGLGAGKFRFGGEDPVPLTAEVDPALRAEIAAAAYRGGEAAGLLAALEDTGRGTVKDSGAGVSPGVGGGRRQVCRAQPLDDGGVAGMVAGVGDAGTGIVVAQEEAGGVGYEILNLEHLQGVLVDGPPRYECTGVAVRARHAKRNDLAAGNAPTNLVIHHHRKRAVAVVVRPQAIRNSDHSIRRDTVRFKVHAVAHCKHGERHDIRPGAEKIGGSRNARAR